MKKLFGAAAVMLACLLAAAERIRAKKERLRTLSSLREGLSALRRELAERQTALGWIFSDLAQRFSAEAAGAFFGKLGREMDSLGERDFAQIWRSAAEDLFAGTKCGLCELLSPLGVYLGGSELELQCEALEKAVRELDELTKRQSEATAAEKRLDLGLSLSAGALLVIMLM